MAKKVASPSPANPDQNLLDEVLGDYNDWRTYSQNYRYKWDNFWSQWNNERINKQYYGDFDTFEPLTHQLVETIVDNTYGSRPQLNFYPTDPDQEGDTDMLNNLWDYSWDKSDMDRVIIPWGREITITGNGLLFPEWADGYMSIRHIPLRDCIMDSAAAKPDDMSFVGYRRLAIIDDLKDATRFDPTVGEKDSYGNPKGAWVPRYKNLDQVPTGGGSAGDLTDAEMKNIQEGTTLSGKRRTKQVEVMCMIYLDKIVEIANRKTIIYQGPNPYHKDSYEIEVHVKDELGEKLYDESQLPDGAENMGADELEPQLAPITKKVTVPGIKPFLPFAMQREFVDPAILLAKGDVETFSQTQENLNDTISMMQDNIAYNVKNVAIIDKIAEESTDDIANAKPGSVIPVTGGESSVRWMEKPNMSSEAQAEIARASQSIRETARVSALLEGMFGGVSVKSAAEINALISQATQAFKVKTRALEGESYKRLGEIFVKMVQIFLTEEQMIRVIGPNGVEFKNFDPDKHWGDYDVKVVLDINAQAQKKLDSDRAMQVASMYNGNPLVNQQELVKMTLTKAYDMDDDDIKLLLTPNPAPPMTPGAPLDQSQPGQTLQGGDMPQPPAPSTVGPVGAVPPVMSHGA